MLQSKGIAHVVRPTRRRSLRSVQNIQQTVRNLGGGGAELREYPGASGALEFPSSATRARACLCMCVCVSFSVCVTVEKGNSAVFQNS